MARSRRVKINGCANYHLMSRISAKRFLFEDPDLKRRIVGLLKRAATFSGIELHAYCIMDDHFHIVCTADPSAGTVPENVPETLVIERLRALKGEKKANEIVGRWNEQREAGLGMLVEAQLNGYRRRMNDISEFVKTFKEMVNVEYKRAHEHTGGLWGGRFKSTLIEDGRYLATCIRYVELNPVRAGMVARAEDYAFSSAREAKARNANENAGKMGTVPAEVERRIMRRVAQIGGGKILGSYEYVRKMIGRTGHCFYSKGVAARVVFGEAYSSHGQRLAAEMA